MFGYVAARKRPALLQRVARIERYSISFYSHRSARFLVVMN
jgi:hypothetical protein